MEKTTSKTSTFIFVAFLGNKEILKTYEKSTLLLLNDGSTCFIPNCFIKTSKKGMTYLSLPKTFVANYRLTDYNAETKERKIIREGKLTVSELKALLNSKSSASKTEDDELPF